MNDYELSVKLLDYLYLTPDKIWSNGLKVSGLSDQFGRPMVEFQSESNNTASPIRNFMKDNGITEAML